MLFSSSKETAIDQYISWANQSSVRATGYLLVAQKDSDEVRIFHLLSGQNRFLFICYYCE